MGINYIILTHKSPTQLERLINALNDTDVYFFIHIDLKANIEQFNYLQKDNVIFLKDRVDVVWGDFSIVQATLNAMKSVVQYRNQGYTILLSGQDYPIKSKQKIKEYLSKNQDFDFIDFRKIEIVWNTYRERTIARKINFSSIRGKYAIIFSLCDIRSTKELLLSCKSMMRFFIQTPIKDYLKIVPFLFKKRKIVFQSQYAGSAWWAFRYTTITKVLNFLENNKVVADYYKESLLPDEFFFQTLIYSLEGYDQQIKDSITYVNWERDNSSSPVSFTENDLDELLEQLDYKLFPRKFDIGQKTILDKIDENIIDA